MGVGGGDVGGVSGFTSQFPLAGAVLRYVAVAVRSCRRVLSLLSLSAIDFTATCPLRGC
jgi:hypothetical protein